MLIFNQLGLWIKSIVFAGHQCRVTDTGMSKGSEGFPALEADTL